MRWTASLILLPLASIAVRGAPPDFDRTVAPLLAARCLDCHSGPKPKGGLDLSRQKGVDPAELWKRVADGEMPPKKPLGDTERKVLKDWVDSGAKWGTDPIDPFRFSSSGRAGYDWWSLQPVERPRVPDLAARKQSVTNEIDRFIRARQPEKWDPAPRADRRTLIRRVYFDLIGLPPTPDEVAAFRQDPAPDAYEKVVDRLLASPHYGERWARHWLDVVRFGETDGFERNTPRPNAWHYRDWVIRALNADMPYDEFARLQLAGDLLVPGDPDAVRATGYLVAGVHNTVLGNDQMRAIARQDELEDIVGGVGQTFLGLTVNCARCHDHKYDPISQTDYYRLAASLSGVGFGERLVPNPGGATDRARLVKKLAEISRRIAAIEAPARAAVLKDKGPASTGPRPVAAWDFRTSADDQIGKLDAKPVGQARLSPDGAKLDGKTGYFRTAPLPFDLTAKTLEAWVRLDSLMQQGGGAITVQTPNGSEFDAIVFGEKEQGRWMAGSNNFVRTRSFAGPQEKDANREFVHVAIVFGPDGTITGYRNGKPYGQSYRSQGVHRFQAGNAVVVFGCRHEPAGGNRMLAGTVSMARLHDSALSAKEVADSFAAGSRFANREEIEARLSVEHKSECRMLRTQQEKLAAELEQLQARAVPTRVYANVPAAPGVTRFLNRGDLAKPGAIVTPAGLSALHGPPSDFGLAADAPDADRRKKLAAWVTAHNNPLFVRVMVNRVWHYHFGTGIVETPSDFGFSGGRPSHPELLDWLSSEFTARGFRLKALHRIIVTSATYQQSSAIRADASAVDAENRLLWRYRPHRLEGEAVRDTMLAVSGLLNPEIGGKGFSDYRDRDFNGTAYFDPFDPAGPEYHRRSVYRFTPRGANQGLLDTFDCPDPASAAPRRSATTTPLQALALWNNGFALRLAEAFAERIGKDAKGTENQVRRAWLLAYQREPTREEQRLATQLVDDHGLKALGRVLFNSNEFVMVD